jgi:hypothetical protein
VVVPDPWPWPVDTAVDRARLVAQEYRRHLREYAPDVCAQLDQVMTELGQGWIAGGRIISGEDIITTADAADLLGITPRAVRLAVTRDRLPSAGRDADGYLFRRADVLHYLTARSTRSVA